VVSRAAPAPPTIARIADRIRELASAYEPPGFEHVSDPDAAIFLCAIDHRTGYRAAHAVGGHGPVSGSALLWELGLAGARRRPGLLTAASLRDVDGGSIAEIFAIGDETIADPERRARLWRDLARGLERAHDGSARVLLAAAEAHLGGPGGLLTRLAAFEAYADPLAKKSFLFAKIVARRGWFEVGDPDRWEVCADNVLMRLALRSGLLAPGGREEVRAATRAAFKAVAAESGLDPPALDDLLWELGRDDPDLLGHEGGEIREPPRDPASAWY
jgi:hypothetical protein